MDATMPKELTLTYHTDPGHGWIEVPKALVRELKVDVSTYSYQRGDFAYLEEDSDAPRFIKAAEDAGYTVEVQHASTNGNSFIRSLSRYQA